MKLSLCFLLSLSWFSVFAQTANQISVPTWSATGIKYKWLTRQPNKVIGLDADGNLTLTTAGGGLQDNFLLNDFTAETLTTGQSGMGWDENGYFTIGSSAGWLQIYEAGDPLENTIHFAGRFTADAIEAASITGDITGPQVASGQIPGGVMAGSMPRPLQNWQNSATYAGANGLTYAATGPGGQTEPQTPAMYFAGIEVIDGDPDANYLQGRIRSASQVRSDLGLVIGTNVLAYTAPGSSGNVLTSNGSAWVSSPPAGAGATLGANTFTGQNVFSAAGATSTSSVSITGAPYKLGTSTTNHPLLYIQQSGATAPTNWSTKGTSLGMSLPAADSYPVHGDAIRVLVDNTPIFSVDKSGGVYSASAIMIGTSVSSRLHGITTQSSSRMNLIAADTYVAAATSGGFFCASGTYLGWSDGASYSGTVDTAMRRESAGVIQVNNGTLNTRRDLSLRNLIHTDYIEGTEMTAPAAPAANKGRIYFEDSGGKTRLMVIFPSGAAQQIAIEP